MSNAVAKSSGVDAVLWLTLYTWLLLVHFGLFSVVSMTWSYYMHYCKS